MKKFGYRIGSFKNRNIRTLFSHLETDIEPSRENSQRDNSCTSISLTYNNVNVRVLVSFEKPLFYESEMVLILGEESKKELSRFRIPESYKKTYGIKTFDSNGKEENIPLLGYNIIKLYCLQYNKPFLLVLKEIKVKSSIWYRQLYFSKV